MTPTGRKMIDVLNYVITDGVVQIPKLQRQT